MEEELSENELEGQMYAILHYVDETQKNVTYQKDINLVDYVPNGTLRRYWHSTSDQNNIYQKINVPKEPIIDKNVLNNNQNKGKNEENSLSTPSDISIFQQPVPENIKRTIEILEIEDLNRVVELESSDEDEVIEVALPPKPTITIESSDDETNAVIKSTGVKVVDTPEESKDPKVGLNREVTASPVPSVVSSISDEFIRGDCIALNISSKHVNKQSFDFSLHGSDLLVQAPTRKRKKKRTKEATSTPVSTPANSATSPIDECFATPKSKAKNKRQKNKSYRVTEKSVPNADVYDSDSNQSINEINKNPNSYSVTDKNPNKDVSKSDSNQSEIVKEKISKSDNVVDKDVDTSATNTLESTTSSASKTLKKNNEVLSSTTIVDLTETGSRSTSLNENIVMGNVSGLTEVESFDDDNTLTQDILKCGSTKIPAILNEDLDFDNLKGTKRVCKRRRYSLTTLRAEMDKFYNESWGGEDFNHREIQKNMSRDKSLWVIDPKDKMSAFSKRKTTCNYCNRVGHRDDTCRMKPPVCFMCGSTGHFEPRCPRKICVNCGAPNQMYSTMCRNCSTWHTIRCAECGQYGHPSSHCPDLWRRYHNTTDLLMPLEENRQFKKYYQIFCSGCTRRGHFVHTCRISLPFSGLPINSPYVAVYRPIYTRMLNNDCSQISNPTNQYTNMNTPQNSVAPLASRNERLKRQSKSPVNHETHLIKKKNLGSSDENQMSQRPTNINSVQKKNVQNKEPIVPSNKDTTGPNKNMKTAAAPENQVCDKAPDFITITSENHDKSGQVIQDNEVSDTSDVVTSARIYVTKDISEKLKTEEGDAWLKETLKKNNVALESDNIVSYIRMKGTVGNQEAFQTELREWINTKLQNVASSSMPQAVTEIDADNTQERNNEQLIMSNDIPKNRNNVLRKLNQAFEALKTDLGDPKLLYKELVYLQNRHQQLLKQKVISPQQLSNNRSNINGMLKKLNMVLLGQAGLADGSKHLNELHLLQEKLTNFRQKNLSTTLREEIGQHFHCIFAAIPRNDYVELLSKFYNKPATLKNQQNIFLNKSTIHKNNKNRTFKKNVNIGNNATNNNSQVNNVTRAAIERTKNKLILYHRRLLHCKPIDMVLKKTKAELVKQLHSQIATLGQINVGSLSKKNFKKMKKIREQVQLFLSKI